MKFLVEKNRLFHSELKVGIIYNFPVMPKKGEDFDYIADAEVEEEVEVIEDTLKKLDLNNQRLPVKNDITEVIRAIKKFEPDVIINLCEGVYGESHLEMAIPSLLELLRIPYTGNSPLALGICQNKGLTKKIIATGNLPTPNFHIIENYGEWKEDLVYPLFVKPLSEDGSIGISRNSYVTNNAELKTQIDYITKYYRQPALVEEYISGREFNISILEDSSPKVLPISEIIFKTLNEPKIVDYSAKWFKDTDEYKTTVPECPANIDSDTYNLLEKVALNAYSMLFCRDYARIDIRLKNNIPYILEVNPNPDISLDGGFSRALKAGNITYEDFIKTIISSTLLRR